MHIDINGQRVTAAAVTDALTAGTEVTLSEGFGATYGLTIAPAEGGFAVTDTTGGDQDAATITEALIVAAGFIDHLTHEPQWVEVAETLAPMTAAEFHATRQGLGLTQAELAARLVNPTTSRPVTARTVRNWEAGEFTIPAGVRDALTALRDQQADAVTALTTRLGAGDALTIPSGERDGFPPGWWRAVAWQVTCEVPGVRVVYAE